MSESYMEDFKARKAAARPRLRGAVAAYRQLTQGEGLVARLAAMHGPSGDSTFVKECSGCDFSGWESEPPEWPCQTAEAIAEHHGIDLSDAHLIEWGSVDVIQGVAGGHEALTS